MSSPIADAIPRLKRLIPRLPGKRIGVVGDLMLDRYLWGKAARLSPEAPVPVVDLEEQSECLGGAANVAANLAALGARVEVFGTVGKDEAGRAIQNCLAEKKIGGKGVVVDVKRVTTLKARIIARHQQVVRVDRERSEPLGPEKQESLLRIIFSALKNLDALVFSDYDKGLINDDFAERVLSAAHKGKVPVFVGLKKRPHGTRGASLVACNLSEAESLVSRRLADEQSIAEAGRTLLASLGCGAVVVTRGDKGMSVFEESSPRHLHIPAIGIDPSYARVGQPGIERGATGRQVLDRTGAGDTVSRVCELTKTDGAAVADAAVLDNAAPGVVVGKLGTASVSPQELLHALEEIRG